MIGQKYGSFTIIKESERRSKNRGKYYICKCECGYIREIRSDTFKRCQYKFKCNCNLIKLRKEKFEDKYIKTDNCWNWKGKLNSGGYGIFCKKVASRWSYILYKGNIPNNIQVCHTCDNRKCVNPDHLFLGSIQDNQQDKVNKNRQAKGSKIASSIITEEIVYQIRKMRVDGKEYQEIADHFKLEWDHVRKICKNTIWKHVGLGEESKNVKQVRRSAIGSKCGSAKLNEEKVKEIKQLLAKKIRSKDIAKTYGVNSSTICDIKQGRTWK